MSSFHPPRASPLFRPQSGHPGRDINPLQDSRSSSVSVPELVALNAQEIEFIDTVIGRAPSTATTFLPVLKVYNDLLQERGLDPQNEVVYFGKLLKLGTVKGKNWKEKWAIVKDHHGYCAGRVPPPRRQPVKPTVTRLPNRSPPKFVPHFRGPDPETDTFTLDSHLDDTELAHSTQSDPEDDDPQYHATPRPIYRRSQSPERSVAISSNSLGLDFGHPSSLPSSPAFPQHRRRPFDAQSSTYTDAAPTQISTPPSYGAAVRDPTPSYVNFRTRRVVDRPINTDCNTKETVVLPNERAKVHRGGVINEDEAWSKVKMLRDEADADQFRQEKLVERCWDVWRQGCEWITVYLLKYHLALI